MLYPCKWLTLDTLGKQKWTLTTPITSNGVWLQLTRAMAAVIILPPDPPITRVFCWDTDCRMVGAIEEGGCSPGEREQKTIWWHETSTHAKCNKRYSWRMIFTWIDVICSAAEVSKLVVEDDTRFRRVNSWPKPEDFINRGLFMIYIINKMYYYRDTMQK